MKPLPRIWRVIASLAAAVAGLQAFTSCPMYGMAPAYGVQNVPLEVTAFSYAPPSPAHVGDTLTFYAELEPAVERSADVYAGQQLEQFHVQLHDDGQAPDVTAGDNVFSGSGVWLARHGTGPENASLYAQGSKDGMWAVGNASRPLDVLP
jgi:hypothetical protein